MIAAQKMKQGQRDHKLVSLCSITMQCPIYSGFQMITLQKGRKYETEGHKLQINWVSGFSGMGIVEWWNSGMVEWIFFVLFWGLIRLVAGLGLVPGYWPLRDGECTHPNGRYS